MVKERTCYGIKNIKKGDKEDERCGFYIPLFIYLKHTLNTLRHLRRMFQKLKCQQGAKKDTLKVYIA